MIKILRKLLLNFIFIVVILIVCRNFQLVYCEEFYTELTNILTQELKLFVRQEEFAMLYKSRFYYDVILHKDFIELYVNNINWKNIFTEENNDIVRIKERLLNDFISYIEEAQKIYGNNYLIEIFYKYHMYKKPYTNYIDFYDKPLPSTDFIRTPSFWGFSSALEDDLFRNFISKGYKFELSFEDNRIIFRFFWYNITIIKIYLK